MSTGLAISIGVPFGSRSGESGPTVPYLLDTIPMTSTESGIAFSVRRLRSDYTGYAMRVVRQSDLAEKDIPYLPNGDLDTSAISSFCGTSDGRLTKWYNQAPQNDPSYVGGDLTQSTSSLRPTVYDGATQSVFTDNGIPTVKFKEQSANQASFMDIDTGISGIFTPTLNDSTISIVSNVIEFEDVNPRLAAWTTNTFNWQLYAAGAGTDVVKIGRRWGNTTRGFGNLTNSQYESYNHRLLVNTGAFGDYPDGYWNGNLFTNTATGPSANTLLSAGRFYLGIGYNTISYYEGKNTNISEFIFYWNQDLTSDVANLNTNTNDYFNIY